MVSSRHKAIAIEPHIAAIIRWLGTLTNDMAIHLQLPPTLASLRGILNEIHHHRVSTATWAAMIEVGQAIEQLARGGVLVHHSDAAALEGGGLDTNEPPTMRGEQRSSQRRGGPLKDTMVLGMRIPQHALQQVR